MKLDPILTKDTAVVEIVNPVNGEGLGISVEIYGPYSDTYRALVIDHARERVSNNVETITSQYAIDEQIKLLARCTKGITTSDGSPLQIGDTILGCTTDDFILLYKQVPILREQVEDVWNRKKGFLLHK